MKDIPRALRYLRPYLGLAAVSAAIMVPITLTTLLTPWPLTILVDNVLGQKPIPGVLATFLGDWGQDRRTLFMLAVGSGVVIAAVSGGLNVLANYVNTKLEQRIVLDFRAECFEHAQRLSVPYADQVSTARLMYGINFEATSVGAIIMAVEPLAQGALTIIGMVWVSFHIDPLLALVSMAVVPFLYYAVGYYATHIQQRLLIVKGMEADSLSIVHDALAMLRVVIAFGRERHEVQRFRSQGQRAVDARVGITVRQTAFTLAVNTITAVGTALVLGLGAYQAMQGRLTAGQLLVILSYVAAVYKPLEQISYTIGLLQDRLVGLQMGFHVLDTEPSVRDWPTAAPVPRVDGAIEFDRVHFSYPGRPDTLRDISFRVEAGQVAAVVGATGAGKTTLVSLIPRFYDPTDGRILLDGIDTKQITLASLRAQVSFVPQEPVLFNGNVRDNIRYGRLDATDDEIVEAARAANAHDFIARLPAGYETTVGERGVQLSGGERQRLCVARAFLKNAPILILDEPTSSIDSKTEEVILDALDQLMIGRTTFMIAHRLSTIHNADLVLVMDRGELVEIGHPDTLWAKQGIYRQLHDAQVGRRTSRTGRSSPVGADGPARASSTPDPSPYRVAWLAPSVPSVMQPGAETGIRVTVRNASHAPWASTDRDGTCPPVRLAYHWRSADGEIAVWDGERTPLPVDLAPGESVSVDSVRIRAPDCPGSYRLEIALVHEGVAWFEEAGGDVLALTVDVQPEAAPAATPPFLAAEPRAEAPTLVVGSGRSRGVNFAGYLRTESGVGSAARGYVRALRHSGTPLALHDLSSLTGNRSQDDTLAAVEQGHPYAINILCADIEPQVSTVAHLGPDFFDGRYTIGIWAWELPAFPDKWRDRFAYYDEIWVATSFIENCLGPIAPVPITRIPPALTPTEAGSREDGRRRIGAEPDDFVFLFIFDFHSHAARKNPGAIVEAFQRAFGPTDRARLVLKCVNGHADPRSMAELLDRSAERSIAIYDEYWSTAQIRDLTAACDAYVSLHRSEGTGLTITDAMALGKPVIATGWSGNMDFMTSRNSFPVEYALVQIEETVGPYRAGETWADPSVDHAADLMRRVFEDREMARERGEAARRDMANQYSEEAVGRIISTRLEAIDTRRNLAAYRQNVWAHFWDYQDLGRRIHSAVGRAAPAGSTIAVVSKGDPAILLVNGWRAWHFPCGDDGSYAGFHPTDDAQAIAQLEAARTRGAAFLVFPHTALWWFEHYTGFRAHLGDRYPCVLDEPGTCQIYDLRERNHGVERI
ncbi:MAG TPA: ATP-binding cassette domain-containing protein [Chloroflexota bacterium]|nr:ATP-binding cassette domain-containing protein [Chloroflexota bacterium]